MYWTKKHVMVCTASHCAQKGANDVIGKLRLDVVRKRLDSEILVNNCGTIDLCDIGPNMVVYPDNVILSGVKTGDVKRVIEYLKGGPVPEDLVCNAESEPECSRRALYAAALELGESVPTSDFEQLVQQHSFDGGTWVAEQQRRGFIAIKPGPDGSDHVTVTKKARDRYSLA